MEKANSLKSKNPKYREDVLVLKDRINTFFKQLIEFDVTYPNCQKDAFIIAQRLISTTNRRVQEICKEHLPAGLEHPMQFEETEEDLVSIGESQSKNSVSVGGSLKTMSSQNYYSTMTAHDGIILKREQNNDERKIKTARLDEIEEVGDFNLAIDRLHFLETSWRQKHTLLAIKDHNSFLKLEYGRHHEDLTLIEDGDELYSKTTMINLDDSSSSETLKTCRIAYIHSSNLYLLRREGRDYHRMNFLFVKEINDRPPYRLFPKTLELPFKILKTEFHFSKIHSSFIFREMNDIKVINNKNKKGETRIKTMLKNLEASQDI